MDLLFFGSFNPVSIAHINLAKNALEKTNAEKVIFIPSHLSYIKSHKKETLKDNVRLDLLNICKEKYSWLEVSTIEIEKKEQQRTYISLLELRSLGYNGRLLLGSDNLLMLRNKWKYVSQICLKFGIICMQRNNLNVENEINLDPFLSKYKNYIQIINYENKYQQISSSEIRKYILSNQIEKARAYLIQEVYDYLSRRKNDELFLQN